MSGEDIAMLVWIAILFAIAALATSNLYQAATTNVERIGATHGCGAYEVDPLTGKTKFVWNDNVKDSTASTGAR